MIYIVMGVSGCGKTTIGKILAEKLALPFYDADHFHPESNIAKMTSGQPLNDEDRYPWLSDLAKNMAKWEKNSGGAVLACSALKETYRTILQTGKHSINWIFLEGSKELILQRIKKREEHFMPSSLLESQFNALEKPSYGIKVEVSSSPDLIVQEILRKLKA